MRSMLRVPSAGRPFVYSVESMLKRADALRALAEEPFDVVVVGGGITGAGVALDAAARGFSVALVEKADFASGTSSRSSKLVHGGLRYLQHFDLGLVREALLERQLMVALAPHLVKPLPLIVAAFGGERPDRLTGIGLNMYDVMSIDRVRPRLGRRRPRRDADGDGFEDWSPDRHRIIDGDEIVERLPALAGRAPTSGYLFYDCQTDDARLVLTVLGEAERFGAVFANRCEVLALTDGGVQVRDGVSGGEFELRAQTVVNATGVWADRLRPEELRHEAEVPVIRPSRGTHLLVPAEKLPVRDGAIAPAGSGRMMFVLPWLGQTLIGTTDNTYDAEDLDHVQPSEEDVEYLLDATNAFFESSLTASDVSGAYAGVRPLISTGDPKKSVDISRKAELYETSSGMITITGGKLTTWRRMAKMTVDRIVERDGRDAPCRTHEIPLGLAISADELPRVEGVRDDAYERLAARYGYAAHDVLAVARERGEWAQPILPGHPDLLAEAVFAARREQALTVGDVLLRRTRLGLLDARALLDGEDPVLRVAAAVGSEAGWDDARVRAEADGFRAEAAAEGLVV
jgi:glycerol-3-phosphate dehydrogenase